MVLKVILEVIFLCLCVCNCEAFSQQKIKDFHFSNYKEDGSKDLEIKGEEALVFDTRVEIKDMDAVYYPKEREVNIKADKGTMYKQRMDADLKDNVYIESDDGISLTTDSLHWEKSKGHVKTTDKVLVKKDSFSVEANGMEGDTELEKLHFQENVEVNLPNKKAGTMVTVHCDGPLEVDYREGSAVFNDNVVVESSEGKMFSDKATVFFLKDTKTIERIVSEGDVKIIRDDNVTFAEKATYIEAEKRLILEGRPRLILFPEDENTRN